MTVVPQVESSIRSRADVVPERPDPSGRGRGLPPHGPLPSHASATQMNNATPIGAYQKLTDELVALRSAVEVAYDRCGRMFFCRRRDRRMSGESFQSQSFDQIGDVYRLLPATKSEWREQRQAEKDGQRAVPQWLSSLPTLFEDEARAQLQSEAAKETAPGVPEAQSSGTGNGRGTMQPSSELQTIRTRHLERPAEKCTGGENTKETAGQTGGHLLLPTASVPRSRTRPAEDKGHALFGFKFW